MNKSSTSAPFSIFVFYIFPTIFCGLMAKLYNYTVEGTAERKFPGEAIFIPVVNIAASIGLMIENVCHFLKITVVYWINN